MARTETRAEASRGRLHRPAKSRSGRHRVVQGSQRAAAARFARAVNGGLSSDGGLYSPKWTSTTYTMLLLRDFVEILRGGQNEDGRWPLQNCSGARPISNWNRSAGPAAGTLFGRCECCDG